MAIMYGNWYALMNKKWNILYLFSRFKLYIVGILLLIILEPSVSSWLYFWLQKMYNEVIVGTSKIMILRTLSIGVSIWLFKRFLILVTAIIKSKLLCEIKQDLKVDLFNHVMKLNVGSVDEFGESGLYVSTFTNDITLLEQRYFSNIISVVSQVISLVILSASFSTLDSTIAVFVLSFGACVMVIPAICSRYLSKINLQYSNAFAKFTQNLKDCFVSFPTIKNYHVENFALNRFNDANQNLEYTKFQADCSLSLANNIGSLLSWFMQIVAIGVGLIKISQGQISLGTLMAAVAFTQDIATPLQGLVGDINSIRSIKEIVNKINCLSTLESQQQKNPMKDYGSSDLIFDHLTIEKDGKRIVNDFSYNFQSGKKYLIVGPNGSGKSSLCKAIKNHFKDYKGQIIYNSQDLRYINNDDISDHISYLTENVSLFNGTVKDNIILNRNYSEEEYRKVKAEANVLLKDDHQLGENGSKASSGEKRRIEIGRSLLTKPKIMLLDEVVSTLDIQTAYEIEKMILGYKNHTIIFISHNFSGKLISEYDDILVMDHGRLIDSGKYEDLIERCDYFRNICDIKFGKVL